MPITTPTGATLPDLVATPLQQLLAKGISTATNPSAAPLENTYSMRTYGPDSRTLQNPNDVVQGSMEAMLSPNSEYIRNARQRGVEYAAERGGLNSSIAAGASQRSAIEAAQPLANSAINLQQQREAQAAAVYMQSRNMNQDFHNQLALLPMQHSYDMLNTLQQYAMKDPTLYTPEVISGYSQFFTRNSSDIMNQLFGSIGPHG